MATEQQMAEFSRLLRQLAGAVYGAIRAAAVPGWHDAYLDARSNADGDSRTSKMRVNVRGDQARSVQTTHEIDEVLDVIWDCKDEVFSPPWFGLKLTVTADGNCETDFNYDPNCEDEKSFYAD